MMDIKTLYYDIGEAFSGICDRIYSRSRPKSVDTRIGSYIVVSFPSYIYNNEMNDDGSYNDYTTTIQIEIYVRDKVSPKNPNGFDIPTVDEKVRKVIERFPISTKNLVVTSPHITFQDNDGDGFSVTIVQGTLRTR